MLREGRIAELGRAGKRAPRDAQVLDARGGWVSPGFVDVHVHGGGGADFMDGTPQAVRTICATHARHGTMTIFPTTTTGSPQEIHEMITACKHVRDEHAPPGGARIAGIHLYGPFFAPDKGATEGRQRVGGLLRGDPGKPHAWCFAKKAAAFLLSRAPSAARDSPCAAWRARRARRSSAPCRRPERSAWACSTHWRRADSVRSRSRATAPTDLPSSSTKRTAWALKPLSNCRRGRRPGLSGIRDIVSTFAKVSTRSDQAQSNIFFASAFVRRYVLPWCTLA